MGVGPRPAGPEDAPRRRLPARPPELSPGSFRLCRCDRSGPCRKVRLQDTGPEPLGKRAVSIREDRPAGRFRSVTGAGPGSGTRTSPPAPWHSARLLFSERRCSGSAGSLRRDAPFVGRPRSSVRQPPDARAPSPQPETHGHRGARQPGLRHPSRSALISVAVPRATRRRPGRRRGRVRSLTQGWPP